MDFIWEKIQVTNGEPSERILIIARKARYVEEWCRIHEINPRSPMIKPVYSLTDCRGIVGMHYVDLGTGMNYVDLETGMNYVDLEKGMYYVDLGTDNPWFRDILERLKALGTIKPLLTPNI